MSDGMREIRSRPEAGANILVVDDDPGMRTLLVRLLRKNGFSATCAADGGQAGDLLANGRIDLILLDVMLPGASGFDICRTLRNGPDGDIPIIMISARGDEANRVLGLELGADDYIAKPFSENEVLARIRAVLRRGAMSRRTTRTDRLAFEGWTVDLRRRELFTPSGATVDLSGAEYDMLVSLLDSAQQVIGREALLEMSRARLPGSSDRSVDVLISRLRRKLEGDGGAELIRTVRGVGYIFLPKVEHL